MFRQSEVATYRALPRPRVDEEAQVEMPVVQKTNWIFRGISGSLVFAAVATVCFFKFSGPSAPGANLLASQMKMSIHYPACPAGTMHQCPSSWNSANNAGQAVKKVEDFERCPV